MSYVGGQVVWDVLLSYAHGNDTQREWSLRVERLLADALNTLLSDRAKDLQVFTDKERLRRNDFIDTQLKPAVESSAALVIIMSEHYLKSPGCQDELRWFQDRYKDAGRIFVMRAQKVPAEEWPEALKLNGKTIFGYDFCDDRADALPYGMFEQQERELGGGIVSLSRELAQFLRDQRLAASRAAAEARSGEAGAPGLPVAGINPPSGRPQVLMGFTTEELEDERGRLAASLAASKELEVLMPPFPDDADQINDLAEAAAKGGAALIQLCGRASGRWRRNADGFVAHQIGLFESQRRPSWLVMAPEVELRDLPPSRYAEFLTARQKRIGPAPTAAEVRQALVEPAPPGKMPACTIFIQGRKDYAQAERILRQQFTAIRGKNLMDALTLPVPPIYLIPEAQQLAELLKQRSQRASDIQAGLLILGDKPDLLVDDLLEYRREKQAGTARWPAAIVATADAAAVTEEDVGYPVFRLGDPGFDAAIAAWLVACLAGPGAGP